MPPKFSELSSRVDVRMLDAKAGLTNEFVTKEALQRVQPFRYLEHPGAKGFQAASDSYLSPGFQILHGQFSGGRSFLSEINFNLGIFKPPAMSEIAEDLAPSVVPFLTQNVFGTAAFVAVGNIFSFNNKKNVDENVGKIFFAGADGNGSAEEVSIDDVVSRIDGLRKRVIPYLSGPQKKDSARGIATDLNQYLKDLRSGDIEPSEVNEELNLLVEMIVELEEKQPAGQIESTTAEENAEINNPDPVESEAPAAAESTDAAAEVELHLKPGMSVYHMQYGEATIGTIEEKDGITFVELILEEDRVKVPFKPENFVEPGSPEADNDFVKIVKRNYKYFPLAVGWIYFLKMRERYATLVKDFLSSILFRPVAGTILWNIGARLKTYLSRLEYAGSSVPYTEMEVVEMSKPGGSYEVIMPLPMLVKYMHRWVNDEATELYRSDMLSGYKPLHGSNVIERVLKYIFQETGDDMIALGFRYFGGMHAMNVAFSEKLTKKKGGVSMALSLNNRLGVFEYFRQRRDNLIIAKKFTLEELAEHQRIFSAGDYDADRVAYNDLRENKPEAVEFWAGKMAEVIIENPRLAEADMLVPIPGREKYGWPVAVLAEKLGSLTGVQVVKDVWQERPEDRTEGEAIQTFAWKEDQAEKAYRLKNSHEIKKMLKGKNIVLIDDNYTTGAAYRAAAAQIRNAGAKSVSIVTATRTNRVRQDEGNHESVAEKAGSQIETPERKVTETISFDLELDHYMHWQGNKHLRTFRFIVDSNGFFKGSTGFGFGIIKNGRGKIPLGGLIYCTRIMIHDLETGINVDSHLPVTMHDLEAFRSDLRRLGKKLADMGVVLKNAEISVLYGAESPSGDENIPGEAVVRILEEEGFSPKVVSPIKDEKYVYLFNLDDGSIEIRNKAKMSALVSVK